MSRRPATRTGSRYFDVDGLVTLPIAIPEYRGSHPFSKGMRIQKYRAETLRKVGYPKDPSRTDWFGQRLVTLCRKLGKPVPYAFRTLDGTPRSLDAGCVGFLYKPGFGNQPLIDLITDREGWIVAVKPTDRLIRRYDKVAQQTQHLFDPPSGGRPGADGNPKLEPAVNGSGANLASPSGPTQPLHGDYDMPFDIEGAVDERLRELSERVIREGQQAFRSDVLSRWSNRCPVTGCDVPDALEAAHLFRYLGQWCNHPRNGIPLRRDIHRLYDTGRLGFAYRDDRLIIIVGQSLFGSCYERLSGQPVVLPPDGGSWPASKCLRRHRQDHGLPDTPFESIATTRGTTHMVVESKRREK